MTTNVFLPDLMKDWVEDQTKVGRYSNASDLSRQNQERRRAHTELQALIAEGLESGVSACSVAYVLEIARTRAATESTAHASPSAGSRTGTP